MYRIISVRKRPLTICEIPDDTRGMRYLLMRFSQSLHPQDMTTDGHSGSGNMPHPLADLSLYVVMVTTVVLLDLIFMRSSGYKIMTQTLHHTANTTLHPTVNTTPSPNVTDYLGEYYSTILNCLARISVYTRV